MTAVLDIIVDYFEDFVKAIVSGEARTREDVLRLKARLCKRHGLDRVPTNYEILARVPEELRSLVEPLLKNKPVRTLSGVAPIAVMTSPYDCPHGRCLYCPGGVPTNTPQSYTGREPAALRAGMNDYDPFKQTRARLEQLRAIGHRTDKVDLILMGGTFTSRPEEYQERFVHRCFDAMNGQDSPDLQSAHELNETAGSRCVGMTVETRPDWFRTEQVELSMRLGATKVEFGVQILDDEILDGVRRGHHVKEVVEATRIAKNAGLKVCYHIMPGLPGSSFEKDMASFDAMFADERFRPDMLKIYPTLVVKGTGLYDLWTQGDYEPLTVDQAVCLLSEMKSKIPHWVRILRIQRDIPAPLIEAGVKKGHLRELVADKMAEESKSCRCIRCREVGHRDRSGPADSDRPVLNHTRYRSSGGEEVFVSFDQPDSDSIVGYARLRTTQERAIVRELHVYGQMVPFEEGPSAHWQHKGYGEKLLSECERLAIDEGISELLVTSGVGARGYYRSLGYRRQGNYMAKTIGQEQP